MTTRMGVAPEPISADLSVDDAGEAFLARFMVPDDGEDPSKKKVSDTPKEGEPERTTQEAEDEADPSDHEDGPEGEGEDEPSEEDQKKKKYVEDEESILKVKVGDDEHEVAVKDLKRLFGQEAALTRKSQEVSTARQQADEQAQRHATALNVMLKRAQDRSAPYRSINIAEAARNLTPEEFEALGKEAQAAFEEEKFLNEELSGFMQEVQKQQSASRASVAKESVKALTDITNPHYVEGWNQKLYDDVRQFAISAGVPKEVANNVIEAPILKIMHMAYMFEKGIKARSQVTRPGTKPQKIVKTSSNAAASRAVNASTAQKALKKLQQSGSQDDAAAAFLARMQSSED